MEAVILAGGFGTRLRTVVKDVPKPMAPVAGKPFLEILLLRLSQRGFNHVVLSLGYLSDVIIRHFGGRAFGMQLTHVVEDEPLGTGGAVRLALSRCDERHVYIFNGDTFLDLEIPDLERLWQLRQEPIVVAREVDDAARYGHLEIENGHIRRFAEKGRSGPGLINAGSYVLPRDALRQFELNRPFSLEQDFLSPSAQKIPLRVFVSQGYFIDIGIPEDFARAQIDLLRYIR